MCEFTAPRLSSGYSRHKRLGEPACDDCRLALNAYMRDQRQSEAKQRLPRWNIVWTLYRIRPHEHQAILDLQGGLCAICRVPFGEAEPHIDHNHDCDHAGKGMKSCADCVRGLLCVRCNSGMAILEDREWLKKSVDYLNDDATAEIIRESRLW